MPLPTSSRRLLFSLALSLLLHAAVLGSSLLGELLKPSPSRVLQVRLPLPPVPPTPAVVEPTIKDTLEADASKPEPAPVVPRASPENAPTPHPVPAEKKAVRRAQRKLAAHLFYPPEAVARGLEGEVRVLLILGADGAVLDAQLAASSGHAVLDQAAVRAALAMGSLPGVRVREMILPVIFQLQ